MSSFSNHMQQRGFFNLPVSGGLSVASSRFFVSGPKTGNTKQRKKDNFVGKDGGVKGGGKWGGEEREQKRGGVGGQKKIIAKKSKILCKKK